MNQNNNRRGLYIYLAVLMAVVFLAMSWFNSTTGKKGVEYNKIVAEFLTDQVGEDRKSTRLNSSHIATSRMPSSA